MIKESNSQSETESSSSSETEDEESLIKRLGLEEFGKDNDMFEEDSDGELDWLEKNFVYFVANSGSISKAEIFR